jgi:hypothetical protein
VLQQRGEHLHQLCPVEGGLTSVLALVAHLSILCMTGGWLLEVALSLEPPQRADGQELLLLLFDEAQQVLNALW